jgi:TonB family protein
MKLRYLICFCFLAFGGVLDAQTPNVKRFNDPEGITADPTGLRRDTSVRAYPKYPRGLQIRAIVGAPVVAFVIDTTGRVELQTASFVTSSRAEFDRAVCDVLPRLRFQPFVVQNQKWRVLLVEMFAFNNWPAADSAAAAQAARSQEISRRSRS